MTCENHTDQISQANHAIDIAWQRGFMWAEASHENHTTCVLQAKASKNKRVRAREAREREAAERKAAEAKKKEEAEKAQAEGQEAKLQSAFGI